MSDNLNKENEKSRIDKILSLSDKMIQKVEKALKEIDKTTVKTKERKKEVKYDEEFKKPISEIYTETENNKTVSSLIDTTNLKQLVSTLKELKEIQLSICENDENGDITGVIEICKKFEDEVESE